MVRHVVVYFLFSLGFPLASSIRSTNMSCDSDLSRSSTPVTPNVTINLRTPNFPNPYRSPFSPCIRNFVGPVGSKVRLMFTTGYVSDNIELYDGAFGGAATPPLIKRMQGALLDNNPKFAAVSTSNSLAVVFRNIQNPNTGFNAQIDTFADTDECPFDNTLWNLLSDGEKIITSSWQPDRPTVHTAATTCSWTFTTDSSSGYIIKLVLNFIDFDGSDSLAVLDSGGSNLKIFTSADNANYAINRVFYVDNHQSISLKFTHGKGTKSAFSVTASSYQTSSEFTNCPSVGAHNTSELLGNGVVMYNPNINSKMSYRNNLNCKYLFNVDSDRYAVTISILNLQMELCCDRVTISSDQTAQTVLAGDTGFQTRLEFGYQYPAGKSISVQLQTDGNTVAQGFYALAQLLDCKCPDGPITLNADNPNATFGPPGYSSRMLGYCNNLNCVSLILAPPGYRVQVTIDTHFRIGTSDSLTVMNGNNGYILGRLFNDSYQETFSSSINIMTVIFNSDNITGPYSFRRSLGFSASVTLVKRKGELGEPPASVIFPYSRISAMPSSSPKSYSLTSDRPFRLIRSDSLDSLDQYWSVTAEQDKQVHLYLLGNDNGYGYKTSVFVIDGTDANGTLIAYAGQVPNVNGQLNAISSRSGSLTVLIVRGQSSGSSADINFLFTQIENDPSKCGTAGLVFRSSQSQIVSAQINNEGNGGSACPVVLVTSPIFSSRPGMELNVSSLNGLMVLSGGIDYRSSSESEILSFASSNDIINPVSVAGDIFLIYGSVTTLTFKAITYYGSSYSRGGSGTKGIMMSENFPYPNTKEVSDRFSFGGAGIDYYEFSINVLRYDLGNTGIVTIKSTVLDTDFSKTLTSAGGSTPMQFCANSFDVNYNSYGLGQKGFVLRYDVGKTCSNGLSTWWIWMIVVGVGLLVGLVSAVIALWLRRRQQQSRRNNPHHTAHPIYTIPSPGLESSPPPSYIAATSSGTLVMNPVQVDMKTSHD